MIEILDLNHVSLVVSDLDRSRHFYRDILGMDEVPRAPAAMYDIAWMSKGSAELHLIHSTESPQAPGDAPAPHPPGRDVSLVRHVALAVRDAGAVVQVLGEHNIPIILGPRPRGDGVIQIFCFDPDGHLVELHTLPTNS
jgi:catechol 2,3-dioxygenase-like lactoylglutathione lyase family enzyme